MDRVFEHLKTAGIKNGAKNETAVFNRVDIINEQSDFAFKFAKDFIGDSVFSFDVALAIAIRAGLAKCFNQARANAFTRHFDKAQIRHRNEVRATAVFFELFFHTLQHLFTMGLFEKFKHGLQKTQARLVHELKRIVCWSAAV